MSNQTHFINKQKLVVRINGTQNDGFEAQNLLNEVFENSQTKRTIENILNEFSNDKNWLILDKVEVDLGNFSIEQLGKTVFLDELKKQLKDKISDIIPTAELKGEQIFQSKEQFDFQQLIYFLENGFFEQNINFFFSQEKTFKITEWIDEILSKISSNQVAILKEILLKNQQTRLRFIHQFSTENFILFLEKIGIQFYKKNIQNINDQNKDFIKNRLVLLEKALFLEDSEKKEFQENNIKNERKSIKTIPETIFIQNAGIVILHPFISILFKNLGWLKDQKFVNEKAIQKALLMWHFLATGEDSAQEYDLVLPKILCGLPINYVFETTESLTENEKKEGFQLLEAVISHWTALKNTSPNGLRREFLQREGKLENNPTKGFTLIVEQKASDVLLSHLGWGISMIKFDWMTEVLFINWT